MAKLPKNLLWAVVPPAAAIVLWLARWLQQGSGNLYTAASKRLYVPDPALGWRAVDGPPWLGLEYLAVVVACTAGIAAAAVIARRKGWQWARVPLWVAGVLPLLVPLWAFAGGAAPADAREDLPTSAVQVPDEGISGALPAPAGTYRVSAELGSAITAKLAAGGESFEARFGAVEGTWTGDPGDLRQPMRAEVVAQVSSVDTGIGMRSKSAREDFLKASEHPEITFRLDGIRAAGPDADGIAYAATGTIGLMGREHAVEIQGRMRQVEPATVSSQAPAVLVVTAELTLSIAETALAPDAGSFDTDTIPIQTTLVLEKER